MLLGEGKQLEPYPVFIEVQYTLHLGPTAYDAQKRQEGVIWIQNVWKYPLGRPIDMSRPHLCHIMAEMSFIMYQIEHDRPTW